MFVCTRLGSDFHSFVVVCLPPFAVRLPTVRVRVNSSSMGVVFGA